MIQYMVNQTFWKIDKETITIYSVVRPRMMTDRFDTAINYLNELQRDHPKNTYGLEVILD